MSGSVLDKYASRVLDERSRDGNEGEAAEDQGCFGLLRGIKDRAVSIELRKKTGSVLALGYGWIEELEFDPSGIITLHTARRKVHIKGQNLGNTASADVSLFSSICRQRVPWIQEVNRAALLQGPGTLPVVEAIEW